MAPPVKTGLSSFAHDTDIREDSHKLKLYIAQTGLPGIGFWWSLLEEIYANGYYLPFYWEDKIMFAQKFSCHHSTVTPEDISYFLEKLMDCGLLERYLYEQFDMLSSPDIQGTYLKECARRKRVEMIKEYLLVDLPGFYIHHLSNAPVKIVVYDLTGEPVRVCGASINGQPEQKDEPALGYDEKYDFDSTEKWDGKQPIDYAGCVQVWNNINGGKARITKSKRNDLKRVFRNYIGKECFNAMLVRAKDEHMKDNKYLTQWSTLFGVKKLENLDKWVDRGREWLKNQNSLETVEDHLKQGWMLPTDYADVCANAGIEFEDPTFCEVKKVEQSLLYYPTFDY